MAASSFARGGEHIYVYYKLRGNAEEARATVARLFADIEARTGIGGRLLERRDPPRTWMEVYEPVMRPAAFLRLLDAAARRHCIASHAVDACRSVERFHTPRPSRARAGGR